MAQKHHQMRIAMARFPLQKTLEGFDFKSQTSIDSKLVRELATGRYMRSGDTCYSSGRPEWGKAICDLGCARPGGSAFASAGRAETKANQADSSRSRCARHDLFVIDDALDGDPICSRVSSSSAPFPCHRLLLSFARASPCLPTSRYYHRSCIEYLRFGPQPSRPLWSTHRQAATSLSSPSRNSGTEPYRLLIKHLKVWLGDGPPVPSQVPPPQSSQFGHQAEGSFQVGTLHPARSPTLYSRVKVEGYVHAYQDCASESPNVFRHPSFLYQRTQANPDYIRLARFPLLDQGRVVTSVEDSILKGVGDETRMYACSQSPVLDIAPEETLQASTLHPVVLLRKNVESRSYRTLAHSQHQISTADPTSSCQLCLIVATHTSRACLASRPSLNRVKRIIHVDITHAHFQQIHPF